MMRWRWMTGTVSMVLGAALTATACGGGSSQSSNGGLDILVGAQPNYPSQFAAWSKLVKAKFKAETGKTLTIETFTDTSDEATKIQSSVVSGTGPDVYILGTTFTPVAYGTKGFVQLSAADWQKLGGKSRFIPKTLAMSGPDAAHQIGVPIAMRPYVLAYNTKLFKAAGITSPPTTWDQLVQDAQKLNRPSSGVYGLALDYADNTDPWKYVWSLTEQSGGAFVSSDLKNAQLDSSQVSNAMTGYFNLLTKYHLASPASAGWMYPDAVTAFAKGKAAMQPMTGTSAIPALESSPVKNDYAFAPMPVAPFGATQRVAGAPAAQSIVSGDNAAVASYSKNKDLAFALLKLITSPAMQAKQYAYFGNLPTNQASFQQLTRTTPTLAPFAAAEKGSTPTAFTGAWADIQNGVANAIVQSLPSLSKGSYSQSSIQSLLAKANSAAQSSLDRAAQHQ